jgi:hypothetical protein
MKRVALFPLLWEVIMPFFLPAYDKTPNWEPVSEIPTGVVLRFQGGTHETRDLYRFIEIFDRFMTMNEGTYKFDPEPVITNADGKRVPIILLPLIRKHEIPARLSFVLFGDYFREMLREYCKRSLDVYRDEEIRECFMRILHVYALGELNPTLH